MEIDSRLLEKLLEHKDETDLEDGSHLDYKQMLCLDTKNERREFAKDLVGFANVNGGFLVIGVEDKTWKPVGIDPQQFNSERIERIGREGVRPLIKVTTRLVSLRNLQFGVIYVPKTHEVHSIRNGQVYVRMGRSVEPADPDTVARLKREKAKWIAAQNILGSLEGYKDREVDGLLDVFANKLTSPNILSHFFPERTERAFFNLKWHQHEFDAFRQACKIRAHPNGSIGEAAMKLITLRAYGLLAAAHLKTKDEEKPKREKIIITMEFDVSEFYRLKEENVDFKEKMFFEWLKRFRDAPEGKYDREIFRLNKSSGEISDNEFLQFMKEWFESEVVGAARSVKLARLETEMLKAKYEALDHSNFTTWLVLANLGLASVSDLFALKLPFKP